MDEGAAQVMMTMLTSVVPDSDLIACRLFLAVWLPWSGANDTFDKKMIVDCHILGGFFLGPQHPLKKPLPEGGEKVNASWMTIDSLQQRHQGKSKPKHDSPNKHVSKNKTNKKAEKAGTL